MKPRNILIASFLGSMVALGLFVNSLFLFVAGMSFCGLMHMFGHHGSKDHEHCSVEEEKATSHTASDD